MKDRIKEILENNPTTMISKENCAFCKQAERLFKKIGINLNIIKMEDTDKDVFLEIINEIRSN